MKKLLVLTVIMSALVGCQTHSKNAPKCTGEYTTLNYQYQPDTEGLEDEENYER